MKSLTLPIPASLLSLFLAAAAAGLTTGPVVPQPADARDNAHAPGPRSAHVMAWHGGLQRVLLLGGIPAAERDRLWGWNGHRWSSVDSVVDPGSRGHFALAWDGARDRLVVHGGLALGGPNGARHGDTWEWDGAEWTRVATAEEGPGTRDHHAMGWDPEAGLAVLFGGSRGAAAESVLLGDTWGWDGRKWRSLAGTGPSPRATHRMAWDAHRKRLVLFGGWGEDGLLGDTWEWDGAAWGQVSSTGPSPRFATRLAYDAARQVTVLFGGRSADGDLADTWLWDGSTWARANEEGPSARNVHGMAYDPVRERVVLYGGLHAPDRLGDTWEWDGAAWRQVGLADPGPAAVIAPGE